MVGIVQRTLGRDIVLGSELARGGEGKIYTIQGDPVSVAKIFHKPSAEKTAKIRAMLANKPYDRTRKENNHISIAWPQASIMDEYGQCRGFTMPYIDLKTHFPLLVAYNPQNRLKTIAALTWDYHVIIAYNIAFIVQELHNKGYVIGDINESNFLFTNTGLVTLVDCDSIQVPKPNGGFYHCTVGKPEFTPPELQGKDFKEVDRQEYSDNFSLAILIFILLMEGRHPFSGVWTGQENPPIIPQHILKGNFPYTKTKRRIPFLSSNSKKLFPPKNALPFEILPPEVQNLMKSCFVTHHHQTKIRGRIRQRPTAKAWCDALGYEGQHLVTCSEVPSHIFGDHLKYCPWCERAKIGADPFPTKKLSVLPATPPSFSLRAILLRLVALLVVMTTIALYIAEYRILPAYGYLIDKILGDIILFGGPLVLCVLLVIKLWNSDKKRN